MQEILWAAPSNAVTLLRAIKPAFEAQYPASPIRPAIDAILTILSNFFYHS